MARVQIGIARTPELAAVVPFEASWLEDGPDADAEVYLGLWPRAEMRAAGIDWSAFPKLRHIKLVTAGANHVGWRDTPDVPVATTPGAMADTIAEHVLALTLAWARGLMRSTRAICAGQFEMGAPVHGLKGLNVGIVGYGGIGKAVAHLLTSLGCTVRAVNRSGKGAGPELAWLGTVEQLPELASQSSVLVCAVAHVRATDGLVTRDTLDRLISPGCLINVSRGPVVVESDLYAWLRDDSERGAGLDVWWAYPKGDGRPFHEPFHELDNVVMTPHNAPKVPEYLERMLVAACADVATFLDTGVVLHRERPEDYAF